MDWKYLWFFSDTSSASTENTSHSNRTSADIVEGDYSDLEQSVKNNFCSHVPNSPKIQHNSNNIQHKVQVVTPKKQQQQENTKININRRQNLEQHPASYFRRSSDSSDINQSGLRLDQ